MTGERFLVTGAAGQDGAYMVERLAAEGVEVHGMCHTRAALEELAARTPAAVGHLGDLADADGLNALVGSVEPTHIVNLAGITSVATSWQHPAAVSDVLGVGPIRLMEAAWRTAENTGKPVRVLQASSAEMFGDTAEAPQTENTPLAPVSPYGAAKAFAHTMVGVFRSRGMLASSAILYNHESPDRPESFVSRKITREVAMISLGLSTELSLGNIDVLRDWGYAPDYVDAMLRIVRGEEPNDFIVASGEAHSVREFVRAAFQHVGIDDWERFVVIDPRFYRPLDPGVQVGDPVRLRNIGWSPSVDFDGLVALMVDADLEKLRSAV
jgi:GDPmannose 4,6-dehydratase